MCVCAHVHATAHLEIAEENPHKLHLSLYHMAPVDQTDCEARQQVSLYKTAFKKSWQRYLF